MGDDSTRELHDALAIRALCERYARAVDSGDGPTFASLFTPDGHLFSNHQGNHFNGREELGQIPGLANEGALTTMHFIANHMADIDGDTATGVTYCMANHLREDRSNHVMMVRYLDRYARASGGEWFIADRQVLIQWTETRQADPT